MENAGKPEKGVGVLLCDDLLFSSRITSTAASLGLTVHAARTAEKLRSLISESNPACVLIDLGFPGLDLASVTAIARDSNSHSPRLIAFGSHVNPESLHQAQAAGCEVAWPRSKFVTELAQMLPQWLRPK